MSKPQSVLEKLDESQRARLTDWLLKGAPFHKAQEMVQQEFGVRVDLPALSKFWKRFCPPALLARRERAVATAEEIAREAARRPGRLDAACVDALKQRAFELCIQTSPDPQEVKAIVMLLLESKKQELREAKLKLARAKFQRDTCQLFLKWNENAQAQEIANGDGDNSEKIELLGRLMFGENWRNPLEQEEEDQPQQDCKQTQ